MSSNDHKKFKTEATQKTSTDTEVISDAVLLPPYSTDHILTVTAPSATSSLTGQVDVELEMSPDGENWCPAQTEVITEGSGGTTTSGVSAEDANLNAVATLPDPNAASPYTFTGNKFALGAKSYDASGTEIDIDAVPDSGTRDFMHQFMSKDKPFNYSAWLKTNTTVQPFGDDYTPVIFRHGGKDKFTNENVLQLTDTGTQNLSVVNFINGNYLTTTAPSSYTSTSLTTSGYSVHSPAYTSSNLSNSADIFDTANGGGLGIGFWYRNTPSSHSGTQWKSLIQLKLSNGYKLEAAIRSDGNNRGIAIAVRNSSGGTVYYKYRNRPEFKDGNWHYIFWKLDASVSGASATNFWIDGSYDAIANGAFGAFTNLNSTNMQNVVITELNINTGSYTSVPVVVDQIDIDSLVFITGDVSQTDVLNIYNPDPNNYVNNTNNPYNATLLSGRAVTSFFRFGDGANDSISTPSNATVEGSSYIEVASGNDTPVFNVYSPNETPSEIFAEEFTSIFDINANMSISGWFKTENTNTTGTLFSNIEGAGIAGLKMNINSNDMTLSLLDSQVDISIAKDVSDAEWHHLILTKTQIDGNLDTVFKVYIDGVLEKTHTQNNITNADLKGTNGFTLLGDGQNNANAQAPSATDPSKPGASLSNWSFHTEILNLNAVKEMYSNGHVRNIKNLTNVTAGNIIHWWKFSSSTNPAEDSVGSVTFDYQDDGTGDPITTKVLPLNSGEPYIVEEDQYGSGVTMSLTKRFNTTTNEWTNVHTNETCVCLSFNGFEDQAEYFAIYTHNTIDVADNNWHNLALSFSGREGASTASTTNFSFDANKHNFVLSIDGNPIKDAHFVGTLAGSVSNKEFTAQERHLKWDNNSEEDYIPHAQLNSNIFESINQTTDLHKPVAARDYKTGFVGYADETSFHSESWFTDSSFNPNASFNNEKVFTLYGRTNALSNRGLGTSFPEGTPYPLRRPSVIGSSTATANQYIDPERYDAATNTDGGLEAWWRWGDTTGDCSTNVNNAIGFESGGTDTRRSLKLNGTYNSEENSETGLLEDIFVLTSSDDIHVPEAAASSGGGGISLVNVIIENVQAGVCNLKNLTSPILQYIRVKFTNSGEAQLGEGKLEAAVHYRKRRER